MEEERCLPLDWNDKIWAAWATGHPALCRDRRIWTFPRNGILCEHFFYIAGICTLDVEDPTKIAHKNRTKKESYTFRRQSYEVYYQHLNYHSLNYYYLNYYYYYYYYY